MFFLVNPVDLYVVLSDDIPKLNKRRKMMSKRKTKQVQEEQKDIYANEYNKMINVPILEDFDYEDLASEFGLDVDSFRNDY